MISEHSYLAALVYRCACVIQIHVPSRLCAVTDSMHGLQKMKCSLGETDKKNYHLNLLSFIDFIGFHVMVLYMMQNNNEMVCTRMMCLRSTLYGNCRTKWTRSKLDKVTRSNTFRFGSSVLCS